MPVAFSEDVRRSASTKDDPSHNILRAGGHGTPPSAGPGGIMPAQSGSGGKQRGHRMGVLKLDAKSGFSSSGKMSVHFMGAAFDRCHSPRAMRASVQMSSPRAQQRSPAVCYEYYAEDLASPPVVGGSEAADPVTPSACRTPSHAQANPFSSILNTPGAQPSPTAINLFQKYFVPSPSLLQQAADAPQNCASPASPMSPGGVARAQRRPALKGRSRFGPSSSPGPAYGTPGSPVVVRSVYNSATRRRVTFMSPGASPDSPWSPGSNISPSDARTPGRSRFFDDEDEHFGNGISTALLSTFEEGAMGWRDQYMAAKYSQGAIAAASPASSSVVSLGMFIEPEEDDSEEEDREVDYAQIQALQELIPMPNYSDVKPGTRSRLDMEDEEEDWTASPTKTPSRRLFDSPGKPSKADRGRARASRFRKDLEAEVAAPQFPDNQPAVSGHKGIAAPPQLQPLVDNSRLSTLDEHSEYSGKARKDYCPADGNRAEYRPSSAAVPMPGRRCSSAQSRGSGISLALPRHDIGSDENRMPCDPRPPNTDRPSFRRPPSRSREHRAASPSLEKQRAPTLSVIGRSVSSNGRGPLVPSKPQGLGGRVLGRSVSAKEAGSHPVQPLRWDGGEVGGVGGSFLPPITTVRQGPQEAWGTGALPSTARNADFKLPSIADKRQSGRL